MLSKAKTKLITSLLNKKYREQHQLFRVEGSNNVLDFLHGDLEAVEIFASVTWIELHGSDIANIRTHEVDETEMKKIMAPLGRSQSLPIGMSDAIGINDADVAERLKIRYIC